MLAYWNLGLSIFSAIAVTRCVPHLLMYLFTRGPHFTVRLNWPRCGMLRYTRG